MFGFRFIRTKELQRLRNIDEVFSAQISKKNETIRLLEEKINSLTPRRDKSGKFAKN